jgi:hypothetical protein
MPRKKQIEIFLTTAGDIVEARNYDSGERLASCIKSKDDFLQLVNRLKIGNYCEALMQFNYLCRGRKNGWKLVWI